MQRIAVGILIETNYNMSDLSFSHFGFH